MIKIVYLLVALGCASAIPYDEISRISNGIEAENRQFPYTVSLQELNFSLNNTAEHVCGGVMITLRHALTAASCLFVTNNNTRVARDPGNHRLFAGSNLLSNVSDDHYRNIANFTIHPEFIDQPSYLHDIAIATAAQVFLNTIVTPLALPSRTFHPEEFTSCTVAGWGSDGSNPVVPSNQLRFTRKYVYNQQLCTFLYNQVQGVPNIFNSMVCAASFDITRSNCQYDEGNALVCDGTLTGILFLTDQCRGSSYPELFTRVSNYTTWIQEVTSSASTYTPGLVSLMIFTIVQVFSIKIIS